MKNLNLLFAIFTFLSSFSQNINEKVIQSKVDEVTVFVQNAQITRLKTIQIEPGTTVLKFKDLSPFIMPSTIQVKLSGNLTVLSVDHQQDFLEELNKPQTLIELEERVEEVEDQIDLLSAKNEVMNEEISFLNSNKYIGGEGGIDVNSLKAAMEYYKSQLSKLKIGIIQNNKKISSHQDELDNISNQINTLTSVKEFAKGLISIKVESKRPVKTDVEITYLVKNAGWLPFYVIKAKSINSPIELVYQAKVKQDTKIDWKNVKIRLSTANPNNSGVKPELRTYYLNYSTPPPIYNTDLNQISGVVMERGNLPLPGANVILKGTTIGTTTDFDGKYSLSIPDGRGDLEFSYIGFKSLTKPISNSVINVIMEADSQQLQEVVVSGYGSKSRRRSKEIDEDDHVSAPPAANIPIPIEQIRRQTTVEFEIELPFSVPSDNRSYSLDMANYNLPAEFKYISIPKIQPAAFLVADVIDWEKYGLLEGEANLFFEDTFVGKSVLDVRYASDTLQLSLGRDKNISINRERGPEFSSKKFIGSKKEEIREWNIRVKNNKQQEIKMEIYDQIPVSTLDEITVEILDKSRGKVNSDNGKVTWDLSIKPNSSKDLTLKYSIKYPKNKRLLVE